MTHAIKTLTWQQDASLANWNSATFVIGVAPDINSLSLGGVALTSALKFNRVFLLIFQLFCFLYYLYFSIFYKIKLERTLYDVWYEFVGYFESNVILFAGRSCFQTVLRHKMFWDMKISVSCQTRRQWRFPYNFEEIQIRDDVKHVTPFELSDEF